MSALLVSSFLLIPLSLGFALLMADERDRTFLFYGVLLAWTVLGSVTALIHVWLPFTTIGDDFGYFDAVNHYINANLDIFDPTSYADIIEQPGYLVLLMIFSLLSGGDLLTFKLVNLTFLVCLAVAWYRIAVMLESAAFGRIVFIGILGLTPLWFYTFFVLKDIAIVFFQSLFLLGVIKQWRNNSLNAWLLISFSTAALIPFRSALVLQNVAVILCSMGLKQFGRQYGARILPVTMAIAVTIGLLAIASSPTLMAAFGVFAEHRIVGSAEMRESVATLRETSEANPVLFPLVYLFSETSGLRPELWESIDADWLRGALALPWIFIFVPFFLFGMIWTLEAPKGMRTGTGAIERMRSSRAVNTPWGVLIIFILSMVMIAWTVGDTTRWRLPDIPAMATIALAGWAIGFRRNRKQILAIWIIVSITLFLAYYILRSV